MTSLTEKIKQEAYRQGFSLVGVTSPEPSSQIAFYEHWIDAGYHGSMNWMATQRAFQRRADPQNILSDCQSIIVLGAQYPAPTDQDSEARIAAYAGNQDYHQVLEKRLQTLVHQIETLIQSPLSSRYYTDTGPVLERELGVRAGLGWIGKNTCLIHPRKGSYFFLAEILLGIPLDPDPPFEGELCGTCTRCMEACPTGCIIAPHTLDATRCISYLTIEYREMIPSDLRQLLGVWIFGCDICQEVCPWNKRFGSDHPVMEEFIRKSALKTIRLDQELTLSQEEFSRKFQGSPIKRTKRSGYLRNVVVAVGNQQLQQAVPALTAAMDDSEPLIRGHAAWALGEIGGKAAKPALQERLSREADPGVKQEINQALQQF